MPNIKYAARINSFLNKAPEYSSVKAVLEAIGKIEDVQEVDLNFPDHANGLNTKELKTMLNDNGLKLNGIASRYYCYKEFAGGAFTNPSQTIRQKAIDETKRAIDAMLELGGTVLTIWPGQDGFRYPFQVDYEKMWEHQIQGIKQVAQHSRDAQISIEYKPDEPMSNYYINDIGTTLLALKNIDEENTGVTLDYCHVLYARENPAYAVGMVNASSKLLGVHLNDGYSFRDDGMPIASTTLQRTLEFLYHVVKSGYTGTYYFDTFPANEDPIAETEMNVYSMKILFKLLERLSEQELDSIMADQDGVKAHRYILEAITQVRL